MLTLGEQKKARPLLYTGLGDMRTQHWRLNCSEQIQHVSQNRHDHSPPIPFYGLLLKFVPSSRQKKASCAPGPPDKSVPGTEHPGHSHHGGARLWADGIRAAAAKRLVVGGALRAPYGSLPAGVSGLGGDRSNRSSGMPAVNTQARIQNPSI
jgi:hypothetical protein